MKRLFDLCWTLPGLLVLWPAFLVIALLIKLDDGGLVFFRQVRVGRSGRAFRVWKFRTMIAHAEQLGAPLTVGEDPRTTRFGRWLRRSKLDELPQLFNVLAGEMSLVGPRPEVPRYVALYSPDQRRVLDLMPGITDPASIAYRHENDLLARAPDPERHYISVILPAKIRINLDYAARATRWTDLVVLLDTLFEASAAL
ncbi:MAG: glycosyl transferase [Gemmatimonadetes bacterium]|nr:MAG: glycosyl transferase [Gemmatimonadota bacterium]PYO79101.1 MAG: glycosyl transferase [Gemmatimonadota bacterium]PYO98969.1 MAG: glycosyl transferase [Gemmatimonadota bacterium]TLY55569.1 MAG: sugar transferase [Gemmatimonadota bacterium]